MEIFLSLTLLALIGTCAFFIAKKRGRNPYFWFFIGFFFGLIGFLVLLLLPKPASVQKTSPLPVEKPKSFTPSSIQSPFKDMHWHYLDAEHKSVGPLYFVEVLQAWVEGKVSVKSYVWQDAMTTWQQIKDLPDLKDLLEKEELETTSQ